MEQRSAAAWIPDTFDLPSLAHAAAACRGCELYRGATQTVFGEGDAHARVVLIGEQPGDKEDRAGRPFVGPAGGVLDRALADAGIARGDAYVTNAVKHFKWALRGKRRIHKKPNEREIMACNPWLLAELTALNPAAVVCMGTTATHAAFGHAVRVHALRGRFHVTRLSPHTLVTVHPSAILRLRARPEWRDDYAREYTNFVADLRRARALLDVNGSDAGE
ncbi:MAG: UdgX family uracil-DNA binding protein [Gammaproteobacteria bacterium]|nr:UdgX family uracil-DNA binding protein [Gammaproteobacteria bacterium]